MSNDAHGAEDRPVALVPALEMVVNRVDRGGDVIETLPVAKSSQRFGRLAGELEALPRAPVDVVPSSDLKLDVRARVEAELDI